MKLEDVPEPVPGPGQVTIRVHAAGVNPVDTYIRAGTYARKPNLPYTPGTDVGGVVQAVGADVTAFVPAIAFTPMPRSAATLRWRSASSGRRTLCRSGRHSSRVRRLAFPMPRRGARC